MSKVKSIVVVCVGLLALTAFASSAASAASWKVNNMLLLGGSAALAEKAPVMEKGLLLFSTVAVECTGENLEGVSPQITHPTTGSVNSLVFTGCKTPTGSACTLVGTTVSTVPINVNVSTGTAPAVTAVFKPKTKSTFATLAFSGGSCAFASEVQAVTGQATVTGRTGQEENTFQEIAANVTVASGELKVGSNGALLKGSALLKLASSLPWSFN